MATVKYCSGAALIKQRLENYDTTLSDNSIEEIIEASEGFVDSIMRYNGITAGTFDAAKHGLLRTAAVSLTCFRVLTFNPAGTTDTQEAGLLADMFFSIWDETKRFLMDQNYVTYLKGL